MLSPSIILSLATSRQWRIDQEASKYHREIITKHVIKQCKIRITQCTMDVLLRMGSDWPSILKMFLLSTRQTRHIFWSDTWMDDCTVSLQATGAPFYFISPPIVLYRQLWLILRAVVRLSWTSSVLIAWTLIHFFVITWLVQACVAHPNPTRRKHMISCICYQVIIISSKRSV